MCIYIHIYILYIRRDVSNIYLGGGVSGLAVTTSPKSRAGGGHFFILAVFVDAENGPVESFMRWTLMGSFEHSNRELLALHFC